jgi:hypothetical protein
VEVFFLNNADPKSMEDALFRRRFGHPLFGTHFESELWRAFKPIKQTSVGQPSLKTVKIVYLYGELFDSETGTVKYHSNGDGGAEDVAHWIRIGRAFHERNWPKIAATIEQELSA